MKSLFKSGIFWTIITAAVGIGLTITFYETSKKEREIVYYIKKEPTKIYDILNTTSKIKLVSNDTVLIKENVYVSNFVLWNSGQLEIKKSDLRKPIIIKEEREATIIDYKIINSVNPEISNFQIINRDNNLTVDWDYFDPNFGLELQVIYSGNDDSEIVFEGYVLGTDINKVITRNKEQKSFYKYIFLVIFIITLFISFGIYNQFKREHKVWSRYYYFQITLIAIAYLIVISYIYISFITGYDAPF